MRVEIDQSGRLEHLNTDTVIAFANGSKGSILIKVGDKRKLVVKIRKSAIPGDQAMPILFAMCIFLLIKDLNKQSILIIDEEYTGKDKIIKSTLEKLLGIKWEGSVRFGRIGKDSPAHHLAWIIHRHKSRRNEAKRLAVADIDKVLFGK